MQTQKTTKFLQYSIALLAFIVLNIVVFCTYLRPSYPDYSGLYQADCPAPSCSFKLHYITGNEYLLEYLGQEIRMLRLLDASDKAYLLNTADVIGTPFAIASIWLDNLDKGHTHWQDRIYYKQ